jgi:Zn-dependent membrane protease YugP
MIFGPYAWLLIPGIILGLYAQIKLMSVYSRYSNIGTHSGLSGAEAAREILDNAGLTNVPVEEIDGRLTDHYDPVKKALFLSSDNFHGRSLAAVGVAAHEAGHALQQQTAYALFNLRMMLVPATQFASMAWIGLLLVGIFFHFTHLIGIAIGIFAVMTLFHLVTLPVEFDASRRAKQQLIKLGLVRADESGAISKVLNAAGMTYVAALVTSVMQLLQFLMIARDERN